MSSTLKKSSRRVRSIAMAALALLAGALVLAGLVVPATDALAATGSLATQRNGVGPSANGATTGMTCTVTVVNTITGS
ncbi:MAG: hypothetical protein ACXVIH_07540, partial [Ilumatobacteraceae bacterium]